MKAYYSPSDVTVISAARICGEDSCNRRLPLVEAHLRVLAETKNYTKLKHIFVDMGSEDPIGNTGEDSIYLDVDYWSESRAKNEALSMVETPLVAFTNADTLVYPETLQRTFEIVGDYKHFILQGYRWEVPRDVTYQIVSGQCNPWIDRHLIQNLSIPHCGPKLAMGEWQVGSTEDFRKIGGFSEDMLGYGGMDTDIHDRMYALTGREYNTRSIPLLHLYHHAERPLSPNHQLRRERLMKFVYSGDKKDLNWQN